MHDQMRPSGRYGVWGVNPYGPTIKTESPFDKALSAARGVSGLFTERYKNQLEGAKAKLAQGTLDSSINAQNTKNQADIQNYPLQQEAKTRQEQETIKHIMAQTGLSYAQAREAGARTGLIGAQTTQLKNATDPGFEYDTLYKQWQGSPEGSARKAYFGKILTQMMSGANAGALHNPKEKGAAGLGAGGAGAGAGGTPAPGNPDITLNPLGGSPRAGFHQGYFDSPTNGPQTLESPTTASATRNQVRTEANAEVKSIEKDLKNGFKPYMGPLGSVKLASDVALAQTSPNSDKGKAAAKRLEDYSLAMRLKREAANIVSRQSAGQAPGVEAAREQELSSFGRLPGGFMSSMVPQSVAASSFDKYFDKQHGLANAAVAQERTGYATPGTPEFAQQQPGWRFDESGEHAPQAQQQQQPQGQLPQQGQQQFQPQQIQAWAQEAIQNGADPEKVKARAQQLMGGG